MGDNLFDRIPVVDDGFEDLDAFPRDESASESADELFALAREHRAANDFDPTNMSGDEFHVVSSRCEKCNCNQLGAAQASATGPRKDAKIRKGSQSSRECIAVVVSCRP